MYSAGKAVVGRLRRLFARRKSSLSARSRGWTYTAYASATPIAIVCGGNEPEEEETATAACGTDELGVDMLEWTDSQTIDYSVDAFLRALNAACEQAEGRDHRTPSSFEQLQHHFQSSPPTPLDRDRRRRAGATHMSWRARGRDADAEGRSRRTWPFFTVRLPGEMTADVEEELDTAAAIGVDAQTPSSLPVIRHGSQRPLRAAKRFWTGAATWAFGSCFTC